MFVLLFAFAVASTALLIGILLVGATDRRCRVRCTCIADSVALEALASIAHKAEGRDVSRRATVVRRPGRLG